ncbi:MAG TPA: hypothetical protein ENG33_09905 [Chloroflexi bacterium]|nr:hypothetical protein [Chloroflexota bacterium]
MGRRIIVLLILAVLVALEYGLLIYLIRQGTRGEAPTAGASPLLSVITPPDNSVVIQGQVITVEVESRVERFISAELWVNGRRAAPFPRVARLSGGKWRIAFTWQAPQVHSYALEVRITDNENRHLVSPPINLEVIEPLYLCFASNRDGDYEIYRMRADGKELEKITDNEIQDREPSQAPDGSLAFASYKQEGASGIWVLRGGERSLLIGEGINREPLYDPSGRYLLFVSNRAGGQELFLLDLNTRQVRQLTQGNSYAGQAAWSPTGEEITFAALREGNWDVYRIKRDGSGLMRLTENPAQDWHPAWAPDGSKIAFVSGREGPHQLYLMNPDGTGVERITEIAGGVEQPVFSPDGKLLAFVAYTGWGKGVQAREIYILSLKNRWPVRLTRNGYDDTDVSWCIK